MLILIQLLAIVCSIIGNIGVIKHRVWGFGFWIVSNILWISFDFVSHLYLQSLLFIIYLGIAIIGFVQWFAFEDKTHGQRDHAGTGG